MATNKKFKRGDRTYWQGEITSWNESGLSQNEYCRRNNLNARSLSNWNRKLKNDNVHSMVELKYQDQNYNFRDDVIELETGTIRIKLREEIDPMILREIVIALRRI